MVHSKPPPGRKPGTRNEKPAIGPRRQTPAMETRKEKPAIGTRIETPPIGTRMDNWNTPPQSFRRNQHAHRPHPPQRPSKVLKHKVGLFLISILYLRPNCCTDVN